MNSESHTFSIESKQYDISVHRQLNNTEVAVRLLIPAYIFNSVSFRILEVCIGSILKNTHENYEIWVIDNNSPPRYSELLKEIGGINLIVNHTEPIDPLKNLHQGKFSFFDKVQNFVGKVPKLSQLSNGAYANAVGLELGCRVINQDSRLVFTMHSDTLVLKSNWLTFLKSRLTDRVRAVACWKDNIRVNALHIGGLLFDFTLFKNFEMNLLPNINSSRFPDRPEYDVGDFVTIKLLDRGYDIYSCKNTYNDPSMVDLIPKKNPLRKLHSDRCFDDEGDLFFAHMGRGTPKAKGIYNQKGKTYPEEWINYAEHYVL